MFDWGIVATDKKKNFHHEAGNPSVASPDSRDAGDCRQSKNYARCTNIKTVMYY